MNRWAWAELVVVIAAGAVIAWHSHRLQTHHLSGRLVTDVDPIGLGISPRPTDLFMSAGCVCRRSLGMQLRVDVAAALMAAFWIAVIRIELSAEWTHGTGLFLAAAWVVGNVVSGCGRDRRGGRYVARVHSRQQHPVEHAEPSAAADLGRM